MRVDQVTEPSTYLSTDQVRARFGGVSRMWIARAIRTHGFPSPLKFGDRSQRGRAFYHLAAIERWEASRLHAKPRDRQLLPPMN